MNEQLPHVLRSAATGTGRSDGDKVLLTAAAFEIERLQRIESAAKKYAAYDRLAPRKTYCRDAFLDLKKALKAKSCNRNLGR